MNNRGTLVNPGGGLDPPSSNFIKFSTTFLICKNSTSHGIKIIYIRMVPSHKVKKRDNSFY